MTNSRNYMFSPGDILLVGTDNRIHKAKLTTRIRSYGRNGHENPIKKYLYLSYRDGDTARQKYLGKLA